MAEELLVIIDNRGDNTVVNALRRLLPNHRTPGVAMAGSLVGSRVLMPRSTAART